MKYRPEIDGLRTFAVIPVILFHLGYPWIDGGYLGVDVFFVISGFLITKILVTDISGSNFKMIHFWVRRVKRLLPTLLSVLLFVLILSPILLFKPNVKAVASDVVPAIFSYFNFHALFQFGDYWGFKAENSIFLHTWSLSVEEQFYLIYPFVLLLSYKYFKRFVPTLILITIVSFLVYTYQINVNEPHAFYLLPSRIWELSIGGIVSIVNFNQTFKNSLLKSFILYIGFVSIITSYLAPNFLTIPSTFLSVFGTAFVLGFCSQNDFLGQILSLPPLVYLGKISYSLYLWHWPIIVFFGAYSWQLSQYNIHYINILIVVITVLISIFSYHFIENKTRKGKHTIKLVVGLIFVAISISSFYKSNFFNIYYNSQYNQVKYYLRFFDISPKQVDLEPYKPLIHDVYLPIRLSKYNTAYKEEGIITRIDAKDPELIVFGDSHGVMWGKIVNEICDSLKISRSSYTSNAVNPFFNLKNISDQKENLYYSKTEKIDYANSVIQNIEKWQPKVVIIACRWSSYNDKEELLNLLDYLSSQSTKVILFNQPPVLEFIGDNNASQYFTYIGISPKNGYQFIKMPNNLLTIKDNEYIKELKEKYLNLEVYDVYAKMTQNDKVVISNGKNLYYFDDDHLSYEGTKYHKNNITQIVLRSLN